LYNEYPGISPTTILSDARFLEASRIGRCSRRVRRERGRRRAWPHPHRAAERCVGHDVIALGAQQSVRRAGSRPAPRAAATGATRRAARTAARPARLRWAASCSHCGKRATSTRPRPDVDGHHHGGDEDQHDAHESAIAGDLRRRTGEPQRRTDQTADGRRGKAGRRYRGCRASTSSPSQWPDPVHHARGELRRQPVRVAAAVNVTAPSCADRIAVQGFPVTAPGTARRPPPVPA
jgi:hypothetical protein